MGASASTRGRVDRRARGKRRRDSHVRPVLKLHISNGTIRRKKELADLRNPTSMETSLDSPLLRRLSKSNTTTTRHETQNRKSRISQRSTGSSSPSHDSMVVVKYIDNGVQVTEGNNYTTVTTPSPEVADLPLSPSQDNHLCWFSYSRVPSEAVTKGKSIRKLTLRRKRKPIENGSGQLRFKDVRKRILDHSIQAQPENDTLVAEKGGFPYHRLYRSQSSDAITSSTTEQFIEETKRALQSNNLLDDCETSSVEIDIEVIEDEECGEGWSFGESIVKHLEKKGIVVFNVDNPQTTSEWEVLEAWPDLKHKMRKWRSNPTLDRL